MSTTPEEMLSEPYEMADPDSFGHSCIACGCEWPPGGTAEHCTNEGNVCPVPAALAAAREEGATEMERACMRSCGQKLDNAYRDHAEALAEALAAARREVAEELARRVDRIRHAAPDSRLEHIADELTCLADMLLAGEPLVPKDGDR
jgi:hypothetical protein